MTPPPPPPPPKRGGVKRLALPPGQSVCISGLSLTDPAAATAQPLVYVWLQVGHQELLLGLLWSERPAAAVPPLQISGGELLIRHDSAASGVRLYGYYLDLPPASGGNGEPLVPQWFVEDIDSEDLPDEEVEEDDDDLMGLEYEPFSEEDLAERNDSDNGDDDEEEEEDDDEEEVQPRKIGDGEAAGESSSSGRRKKKSHPPVPAPAGILPPPDGVFLGPPEQFAAVQNTAGFMRIIAAAEAPAGIQQEGSREIVVLYRYTRFSKTRSGRRGVEAFRRTKLHWLRFAVPPAGDMAGSLAWAGASLSPLIYPALFRRQLQELWSSLAPPAATAAMIPARAARLWVTVDVGILRRADHTEERMEYVEGELDDMKEEAWPKYYHVGMELQLPEPVLREEDGGGGKDGEVAPLAKRMRVAAGAGQEEEEAEECCVCLDPMDNGGLAAWPGCRHEFHGECVEKTLARSEACPLCRRKLSE